MSMTQPGFNYGHLSGLNRTTVNAQTTTVTTTTTTTTSTVGHIFCLQFYNIAILSLQFQCRLEKFCVNLILLATSLSVGNILKYSDQPCNLSSIYIFPTHVHVLMSFSRDCIMLPKTSNNLIVRFYKLIFIHFCLLLLVHYFASINISKHQECPLLHQFSSSVGRKHPCEMVI